MNISVAQAIERFYKSAQCRGQFAIYDLLEFVRNVVNRRIMDSALTAECRRLRGKGRIDYFVVDDQKGLYEFKELPL